MYSYRGDTVAPNMPTINKQTCTCQCGHTHTISERKISMYKGLVIALWNVLQWCDRKEKHEFVMSEIKHLLDKNEYARFGDWVLFGGLVYKKEKSEYGINVGRCMEFFSGRATIPREVYKNPITRQITPGQYILITQVPKIGNFLDDKQQWISEYRTPSQLAFGS